LGALAKIFFVPSIDFCIPATYLMLKLTEFHHLVLSPLDTYVESMVGKPSEVKGSINEPLTTAKAFLSMLGITWIIALMFYLLVEYDLKKEHKRNLKSECDGHTSFFKKAKHWLKLPGNLEVAFGMLMTLCVVLVSIYLKLVLVPSTPGGVAVAVDISASSLEDTTPEVAEMEGAKQQQLPNGETAFWVVLLVVTTCLTTILYFV
jgi:hypothetical protein